MTTLILIRHGQSEANLDGVFAGQTDAKLLDKGIRQAEKTAEYIAAHYQVDAVYASDLSRAKKTGEVIAKALGLSVNLLKELREIDAGRWQGRAFDDLVKNEGEAYEKWLRDIGNCRCPGGESVRELGERVLAALTEISKKHSQKTVVIATHATPIRVFQCMALGLSLDTMKDIPWVSNTSLTEVAYENGAWRFSKVGDDVHLSELRSTFGKNV